MRDIAFALRYERSLSMKTSTLAAIAASVCIAGPAIGTPVIMEWCTVGNAGNAAHFSTGRGAVAYEYRISAHEVTNSQYAAFLNSVAASDPHGLFALNMEIQPRGGIIRSGTDGNYTYSVRTNMGDKPVNYVSWWDAARMANWMTNGQGLNGSSGDTETGVYTFDGTNSISAITRDLSNPNQVFIPTEDEWYKAAYHQPFEQGGLAHDYWLFATQTQSPPGLPVATSTGDVANPSQFTANYAFGADWNGVNGNVTTVGSAGSTTFYGAFDMNGNLWEWCETRLGTTTSRMQRGGSWGSDWGQMQSTHWQWLNPSLQSDGWGFRLASNVPNCSADVDGSGTVDLGDLNAVLANFGQTTSTGDTNGDGVVDLTDLNSVLAGFGEACP